MGEIREKTLPLSLPSFLPSSLPPSLPRYSSDRNAQLSQGLQDINIIEIQKQFWKRGCLNWYARAVPPPEYIMNLQHANMPRNHKHQMGQ